MLSLPCTGTVKPQGCPFFHQEEEVEVAARVGAATKSRVHINNGFLVPLPRRQL